MKSGLGWFVLVGALGLLSSAGTGRASCFDPRGCFSHLCLHRGDVVEMTVLEQTEYGLLKVRVDGVRVIGRAESALPSVGDEIEIAPFEGHFEVGTRLVGVTPETFSSWRLWGLDEASRVSCLYARPDFTITLDEFETLLREDACEDGTILPPPLRSCDDTGDDCAGGGTGWLGLGMFVTWRAWRSGRARPRPELRQA